MSDEEELVKRLREVAPLEFVPHALPVELCHEAADAIEALRASLARAEERALAYFRVAQRSAEITPDDIAWANEQAARLGLSATPPEEEE